MLRIGLKPSATSPTVNPLPDLFANSWPKKTAALFSVNGGMR
jgi:hypothetical protein